VLVLVLVLLPPLLLGCRGAAVVSQVVRVVAVVRSCCRAARGCRTRPVNQAVKQLHLVAPVALLAHALATAQLPAALAARCCLALAVSSASASRGRGVLLHQRAAQHGVAVGARAAARTSVRQHLQQRLQLLRRVLRDRQGACHRHGHGARVQQVRVRVLVAVVVVERRRCRCRCRARAALAWHHAR
jgi:hypothetical protein